MNNVMLTDESFLLYAAHYYDNPQSYSTEEFIEDINRIKYLKKLATRYQDSGVLKERLVINHLIVLSNVFPVKVLNKILYLKMKDQFGFIKPFLILLNILQDKIYDVNNEREIDTTLISMDNNIVNVLRKI